MMPDYIWERPSPELANLQRETLRRIEELCDLLHSELQDSPVRDRKLAEEACDTLRRVASREWFWHPPESAEAALKITLQPVDRLRSLVAGLGGVAQVVVVPDASFLVDEGVEPNKWTVQGLGSQFTALLVAQVIREMDEHKRSDRQHRRDAGRAFNKQLKEWQRRARTSGTTIIHGVKIENGIRVAVDPEEPKTADYIRGLSQAACDDRILAGAISHARRNPSHELLLLTNDRLMSLKAERLRLPVTDAVG
jgi:hypothetical protein